MFFVKYALKSLLQRRRQYLSLFAVCTISVTIILSLLGICEGMLNALDTKAIQYYGGELQLLGAKRWDLGNPNEKVNILTECLDELKIDSYIQKRFDLDGSNVEFYFEGAKTFCRIMKGIEPSNEKNLLSKMTLTEGSIESIGKNFIFISEPVAEKLSCHAGDSITIMMKTTDGYINTADLIVSGIFQDSSLFGMYTAYLYADSLQEISAYLPGYFNRICFYPKKGSFSKKQVKRIQEKLSEKLNMAPLPENKTTFLEIDALSYSEPVYALITLDANRPEVVMMSNALRLIVYLIIIPLVLIVAIGIGCSYRVVILKRIVETSTFRALGLKPKGVMKLFFTEVLMILLVGFVLGTGLSFAVTAIIGHFNFSFIPAFDLFLIGGKIKAEYSFVKILLVLLIIAFSTLTGVFVTLRKIIHLSPAKAFATTV